MHSEPRGINSDAAPARSRGRTIAARVGIAAAVGAMAMGAYTLLGVFTKRGGAQQTSSAAGLPLERLGALGANQSVPFAADGTTSGTLSGLRDSIVREGRQTLPVEQAEALADAFVTRLSALMRGDYAAHAARVQAEGYLLPAGLAGALQRAFNEVVRQSRSWRFDPNQVDVAVNARPALHGAASISVEYRAASGADLIPGFPASARQNAANATVRIGVLWSPPEAPAIPTLVGYQFVWNARDGVWVAVQPNTLVEGRNAQEAVPMFPVF